MKYIIGVFIGIFVSIAAVAVASEHLGMIQTEYIDVGVGGVKKIYDQNNNVVCYAYKAGYAGGISCLKNP